jgi:CHAD domain-containing protein
MEDLRADLHSLSRRSPVQPVKAIPVHITADLTAEDAFRATLSDCLAQMTANAGALRGGRSVEGLHQLRVAFRRLEVTLGAFGKEFALDWLEELRGRGKVLSSRLAAARDLDVFVCDLLNAPGAAATGAARDSFVALRARAERARDAAWDEASECVAGADFAMFLDDVAGLAQSRLPLGQQRKLPRLAGRLLARAARRVKKRGRTAQSREARDLHHLRIALKKLRYTAEFLASLYPRRKARRYLEEVRLLQEHLGALNDIAHARATVAALMRADKAKSDADARFAAGAVTGWYDAKSQRIVKQALKRYRKFRAIKPFWD